MEKSKTESLRYLINTKLDDLEILEDRFSVEQDKQEIRDQIIEKSLELKSVVNQYAWCIEFQCWL